MRAAAYQKLGAARDVLFVADLAMPLPGPNEVRVRVAYSGINPTDVKRRAGVTNQSAALDLVIPHNDGAGTIDAVGSGVSPARIGERVWVWGAQAGRVHGTACEYVCLPSHQAVTLTANADLHGGACLGVPALTAHRAVLGDGPVDGKTVLVSGASGAVGRYAVQFARLSGAKVIATAGSTAKAAAVRNLGADVALVRDAIDIVEQVLDHTDGRGVDRIVEAEFGLNVPNAARYLAYEGVVYVYGSAQEPHPSIDVIDLMQRGATLQFRSVFAMPDTARDDAISDIAAWLAGNRLVHPECTIFPLEDIAAAHEAVEAGRAGKVLIRMDGCG